MQKRTDQMLKKNEEKKKKRTSTFKRKSWKMGIYFVKLKCDAFFTIQFKQKIAS